MNGEEKEVLKKQRKKFVEEQILIQIPLLVLTSIVLFGHIQSVYVKWTLLFLAIGILIFTAIHAQKYAYKLTGDKNFSRVAWLILLAIPATYIMGILGLVLASFVSFGHISRRYQKIKTGKLDDPVKVKRDNRKPIITLIIFLVFLIMFAVG